MLTFSRMLCERDVHVDSYAEPKTNLYGNYKREFLVIF